MEGTVNWTADEKTEINGVLFRARYRERMKQMKFQRGGPARSVARKDKMQADDEPKVYKAESEAPTKAKVRRSKHNQKAKQEKEAAKKTTFVAGQGDEQVTFHLDE